MNMAPAVAIELAKGGETEVAAATKVLERAIRAAGRR